MLSGNRDRVQQNVAKLPFLYRAETFLCKKKKTPLANKYRFAPSCCTLFAAGKGASWGLFEGCVIDSV